MEPPAIGNYLLTLDPHTLQQLALLKLNFQDILEVCQSDPELEELLCDDPYFVRALWRRNFPGEEIPEGVTFDQYYQKSKKRFQRDILANLGYPEGYKKLNELCTSDPSMNQILCRDPQFVQLLHQRILAKLGYQEIAFLCQNYSKMDQILCRIRSRIRSSIRIRSRSRSRIRIRVRIRSRIRIRVRSRIRSRIEIAEVFSHDLNNGTDWHGFN